MHHQPATETLNPIEEKKGSADGDDGEQDDKVSRWDGWPDGTFALDVDWKTYQSTGDLMTHWACKPVGGSRKGDEFSSTWQGGKLAKRVCLGVIVCNNDDCPMVVRPQTRSEGIANQLLRKCHCGASLSHFDCGVEAHLFRFNLGIHYIHTGIHNHLRPTHTLHLTKNERARFEAIITANPLAGPLSLVVGVRTLHGPGDSVADISPMLLNVDRVRKERQQFLTKRITAGEEPFLEHFAAFTRQQPDFIVHTQIGDVTVIVMQSPFMASLLVSNYILENSVNGIVSDAAHGFWTNRKYLLIISSCYSPDLNCWVPTTFTFSNGASAQHYQIHFLALFQRIEHEATIKKIPLKDELFAGVSHPGFILKRIISEARY